MTKMDGLDNRMTIILTLNRKWTLNWRKNMAKYFLFCTKLNLQWSPPSYSVKFNFFVVLVLFFEIDSSVLSVRESNFGNLWALFCKIDGHVVINVEDAVILWYELLISDHFYDATWKKNMGTIKPIIKVTTSLVSDLGSIMKEMEWVI